jgi:hypothetical protein
VAREGCYEFFIRLANLCVLVVLVVQMLKIVFVVIQVCERVRETTDASTMQRDFYLVPALGNLENDATDLGVEMVFYLVVTSFKSELVKM